MSGFFCCIHSHEGKRIFVPDDSPECSVWQNSLVACYELVLQFPYTVLDIW